MTKQERINKFCGIFDRPSFHNIITSEFRDWLLDHGFFDAPASATHHGNYEGGLFDHSLTVAFELARYTSCMNIRWQRPESPFIVGMFHDLCKIDEYKRNDPKVILTGDDVWIKSDDCILKGHGDKSVMLLSRFITLTEEEIFCIRFHMGAYQTEDWNSYGKAIEKYQTVLFTHTADMYASRVKGV